MFPKMNSFNKGLQPLVAILLLFFISCSGCNSTTPAKSDADVDTHHTDVNNSDADHDSLLPDYDSCDGDVAEEMDIEVSDDDGGTITPDNERCVGGNPPEYPDMYNDPYGTFYGDSDQHVAYKYYGDYDVISSDPEAVKCLWDDKYRSTGENALCRPAPYDACVEHYPFEPQMIHGTSACVVKDKNIGAFQCDALLTPGCWNGDQLSPHIPIHEKDGKVLFSLTNSSFSGWQPPGIYVYDIDTRQIIRYGRGTNAPSMNNDYIFMYTTDYAKNYSLKDEPDYTPLQYELVYYDKKHKKYGYAWKMPEIVRAVTDLRASKTHLFATIYFKAKREDGRLMYTKIGEWDKWKEITFKKEQLGGANMRGVDPVMLDQYVVYYNLYLQVTFCDLEKGTESCFLVSKPEETARSPKVFDKNTVFYVAEKVDEHNVAIGRIVKRADITDKNNIKYETVFETTEPLVLRELHEDYLLYWKRKDYGYPVDNTVEGDICYYRFKDKKHFCLDKAVDKAMPKKLAYYHKHMLVFTSEYYAGTADIVVRDMECYCDFYPDKCPFEDYTPNTAHPKEPWKK